MKSIKYFLEKGYAVNAILSPDYVPMSKQEVDFIIENYSIKENTYFAYIYNLENNDDCSAPITTLEELKMTLRAYNKDQEALEFSLQIVCEVMGTEENIDVSYCVQRIEQVLGWKVKKENSNKFSIFFTMTPDETHLGDKYINEVRNLLFDLSLKNKVGFKEEGISWSKYTRANPLHIHSGKRSYNLLSAKITKEDIDSVDKIKEITLEDITEFYGSITKGGKIAAGYSILEKIFDIKGQNENVLSEKEKNKILNKLREDREYFFDIEGDNKIERIKQSIEDYHSMFKRNKNERIAFNISKQLVDEKEGDILRMIRGIARNRARSSHQLKEPDKNYPQQIEFIERILFKKFDL